MKISHGDLHVRFYVSCILVDYNALITPLINFQAIFTEKKITKAMIYEIKALHKISGFISCEICNSFKTENGLIIGTNNSSVIVYISLNM